LGRHRDNAGRSAVDANVERADVEVQIFDLPRPVAIDRRLEAEAGRPAAMRRIGVRAETNDVHVGFDIGPGAAAGSVDHPRWRKRISDATTNGGKPWHRQARCRPGNTDVFVLIGPLEVALDAEHPVAGLPVVADLAAAHDTTEIVCAADAKRRRRY